MDDSIGVIRIFGLPGDLQGFFVLNSSGIIGIARYVTMSFWLNGEQQRNGV